MCDGTGHKQRLVPAEMVAAARVAEALLKSFPRGTAVSFRTLAGDVQLRRHVDAWGMQALGWGAGGPRAVWEREGCMGATFPIYCPSEQYV